MYRCIQSHGHEKKFKVYCPEDRVLICVMLDISIIQRKTSLTISVLTGESVSVESAIVRVASLSTTEISE